MASNTFMDTLINKTIDFENIESMIANGTIYDSDIESLRKYLQSITPPPISTSLDFHYRVDHVTATLHFLILNRENDLQFLKSIRWAKIAGIAAILAVVLTLCQIGFSIYQHTQKQSKMKQEIQQLMQNNPQPTKKEGDNT